MSAHTKGEWVVVVEPERPDEPAIMVDEWYVATCHDNANDGDTLANARLIAAAPELLEALRPIAEHGVVSAKIIADARAAYAKAVGGDK